MPEKSAQVQSPVLKASKDVLAGTCGKAMYKSTDCIGVESRFCNGRHKVPLLAGGIAVTFVGHPFDTVKVRLQTQDFAKPIYCAYPAKYLSGTRQRLP